MTNIDPQQINKEACAWIARLHGTEPSAKELASFRAWMARSPRHKAEVRHLARLWGELNVMTELAVGAEATATTGSNWQTLLGTWFTRPLATAVVGVAAIALVATLLIRPLDPSLVQPLLHTTAIGEQQLFNLEDGSSLLLNTNSQVRVDYTDTGRDIYLIRGQAHFEVASNPNRPFRVYAGQGMVRAVGTAFSVYVRDSRLLVTVTEGVIELNSLDHRDPSDNMAADKTSKPDTVERVAVVNAGQHAVFNPADKVVQSLESIDPPALSRKLAWRKGLLRFSGDSLEDVVSEVSRYTATRIVILDPEIRDIRIGGFFRVGETEKMFEALESSFGVEVLHVDENLIHLQAKSPQNGS